MDKKETILDGILSYLEFVLKEEWESRGELQYVNNVGDMLDLLKKKYIKTMYFPTIQEIAKELVTIHEESICKYYAVFGKTLIEGSITIHYAYDGIDFSESCRLYNRAQTIELREHRGYIEGTKTHADSYFDLLPFKASKMIIAEDTLFIDIAKKVIRYKKAKEL